MKKVIPEGMRDYTFDECKSRREILNLVCDGFLKWGYKEISTPTIEFYETFNDSTESLKEEDMYKFFDNNGKILVLRPDMTVPVARMISTKLKDLELPARLFYNANTFRVNESMIGRRNEYIDCGIELIGAKEGYSDLEVLIIAMETLKAMGKKEFKLEIGNVQILKMAMEDMNLDSTKREVLAELIDKKSLTTLNNFLTALNLSKEHFDFLARLPWLFGDYSAIDEALGLAFNEKIKESILYLKNIYEVLTELGYGNYITFDLSIVPKLNYYTGIIFNGYIEGVANRVLRGGRYDNLARNFGSDLAAVGFSVDINSIVDYLKKDYLEEDKKEILKEVVINSENFIEGFKEVIALGKSGQTVKINYKE